MSGNDPASSLYKSEHHPLNASQALSFGEWIRTNYQDVQSILSSQLDDTKVYKIKNPQHYSVRVIAF